MKTVKKMEVSDVVNRERNRERVSLFSYFALCYEKKKKNPPKEDGGKGGGERHGQCAEGERRRVIFS
jgi:hypothetical protein